MADLFFDFFYMRMRALRAVAVGAYDAVRAELLAASMTELGACARGWSIAGRPPAVWPFDPSKAFLISVFH